MYSETIPAKSLLLRTIRATFGLIMCGLGIYLTVQAGIGLGPWDVFSMGLSKRLNIPFGTTCTCVSLCVLLVIALLKEHIGIGTVLDALVVGASLNVFDQLHLVPMQTNPIFGALMMIAGLTIVAFFQYVYMTAGLCCGPRDTLLVGLGKHVRKMPIGAVSVILMACVLTAGILMGGPVGLGTVISVFGTGAIMQMVFRILKFEPRDVHHVGFAEMLSRHRSKA